MTETNGNKLFSTTISRPGSPTSRLPHLVVGWEVKYFFAHTIWLEQWAFLSESFVHGRKRRYGMLDLLTSWSCFRVAITVCWCASLSRSTQGSQSTYHKKQCNRQEYSSNQTTKFIARKQGFKTSSQLFMWPQVELNYSSKGSCESSLQLSLFGCYK